MLEPEEATAGEKVWGPTTEAGTAVTSFHCERVEEGEFFRSCCAHRQWWNGGMGTQLVHGGGMALAEDRAASQRGKGGNVYTKE